MRRLERGDTAEPIYTNLIDGEVPLFLDLHYLHRDPALAESAIRKLETKSQQ